jgi:hypothetical protein
MPMLETILYSVGGLSLLSTAFMAGHTVSTRNKLDKFVKKDSCHEFQINVIQKIDDVKNIVSRIEGKLE